MKGRGGGLAVGRVHHLAALAAALAVGAGTLAGCGGQASGAPARSGMVLNRQAQGRAAADPAQGSPSGVAGGALFGANYPLVADESSFGRKLAIVRLYYDIGSAFPGATKYAQLMAGGRTLLVSLDSPGPSYSAIAAGQEDSQISAFLTAVNRAAVKYGLPAIYVSFTHEPDSEHHRYLGTPEQFVQAWDHVHQLAASEHLDWNDGGRLHWVLILIHSTYASWRASTFWPGNDEVDLVAADGYNSYGCGQGKGQTKTQTPADTFGPLLSYASAHGGIPVFLAEWGSDDLPPGTQASYIGEMQSYVASHSEISGVMYWDTHVGNCNYKIDGNSSSLSAFATMGQAAALQGYTVGPTG